MYTSGFGGESLYFGNLAHTLGLGVHYILVERKVVLYFVAGVQESSF